MTTFRDLAIADAQLLGWAHNPAMIDALEAMYRDTLTRPFPPLAPVEIPEALRRRKATR